MGSNVYATEQERLTGVKKLTLTEEILAKLGEASLDAKFDVDTVLKAVEELGYEIKKKELATTPAATTATPEN